MHWWGRMLFNKYSQSCSLLIRLGIFLGFFLWIYLFYQNIDLFRVQQCWWVKTSFLMCIMCFIWVSIFLFYCQVIIWICNRKCSWKVCSVTFLIFLFLKLLCECVRWYKIFGSWEFLDLFYLEGRKHFWCKILSLNLLYSIHLLLYQHSWMLRVS